MEDSVSALRSAVTPFEFMFFAAVRESGVRASDGLPFIELQNGDVLFGFSNWRSTYYAPTFEQHAAGFHALNIKEAAFGAAFDGLISYHYENACSHVKSFYMPRYATVFDVGVRGGHWMVKASRMGAHVFGVDATDHAEQFADAHIRANGLGSRFIRAAVAAADGDVRTFYGGSSGEGWSGYHRETRNAAGAAVVTADVHAVEVEVRTRSLDSIADEHGVERVDMIILEINGAEREAIAGAGRILRRDAPVLYVTNYHTPQGGADAEIDTDLASLGYDVAARDETTTIYRAATR